jgi:hypothetical protein
MLELITWPPHSPDLTPLDFFLRGYMRSLVYETPAETQHDLVGRTTVAAGTIREMPGIFQTVILYLIIMQRVVYFIQFGPELNSPVNIS